DRTGAALKTLEPLGKNSGMLDGGTVGEKAADDVNKTLDSLSNRLSGKGFLAALRAKNLAPNNGVESGAARWAETYGFETVEALKTFLREAAASGKSWDYQGKPKDMTLEEKKGIVDALAALSAAEAKNFPDQAKPAAAVDFWKSLETPGE